MGYAEAAYRARKQRLRSRVEELAGARVVEHDFHLPEGSQKDRDNSVLVCLPRDVDGRAAGRPGCARLMPVELGDIQALAVVLAFVVGTAIAARAVILAIERKPADPAARVVACGDDRRRSGPGVDAGARRRLAAIAERSTRGSGRA